MPDLTDKQTFSDNEALDFHSEPTPGKISMAPTKPMATQRDLSLAYSPRRGGPGSGHRRPA